MDSEAPTARIQTIWLNTGSRVDIWRTGGRKHREDGPAFVQRDRHGRVVEEVWFRSGERHRLDGPARVTHRGDGSIHSEAWYYEGALVTPEFIHDLAEGTPDSWARVWHGMGEE